MSIYDFIKNLSDEQVMRYNVLSISLADYLEERFNIELSEPVPVKGSHHPRYGFDIHNGEIRYYEAKYLKKYPIKLRDSLKVYYTAYIRVHYPEISVNEIKKAFNDYKKHFIRNEDKIMKAIVESSKV